LIVVKRYPNRKLYNTAAKRYVSLDILADLIREGEDVQVVDHATGDDVTVLVLAQIIAEQERKQGGFLPIPLLTGWIQAGGETLTLLRRGVATQFDMVRQVDEEIERRLARLVSRGELTAEDARRLVGLLLAQGSSSPPSIDSREPMLESLRSRYGIPSRADLQALSEQLDALTQQVDALRSQMPTEP
jgi:polyhydroxyalkanoate synthesis repressor PhaR